MALVPSQFPNQSLLVPDRNLPDRLLTFAEQLQASVQMMSEETQQHLAFHLSRNSIKCKAFDGKILDTKDCITAVQNLQEAMRSVMVLQESIQNNASRAKRIRKDVHFSLSGGSGRLQLHTCRKGETFEVIVPRKKGENFGIRFCEETFVVLEILEGGCVQNYNESQPWKPILVGDTLLELSRVELRCNGSRELFRNARAKGSSRLKIRRQPSDFCVVDGVCLNKIIEGDMLWVAPAGKAYEPSNVTSCKNVEISLDAADAAHPSRLGFVNRSSARYTLCDGMSLSLCQLLDKTHVMKLSKEDPHESRPEHKQHFLAVWYEKNFGIPSERKSAAASNSKRDRAERSRSPVQSIISQGSCSTDNAESSTASITCDPEDKCFVRDTLLRSHSGHLVRVDELEMGAFVLGASGSMLQVMQVLRHAVDKVDLVELRTHNARLKVTACHRVMVIRGDKQAAPASSLRTGDDVVDGTGESQSLTEVIQTREDAELFRITLNPDEPVEAFMVPQQAILSFGHAKRKTRRSGMRQQLAGVECDAVSIPNTDDPFD